MNRPNRSTRGTPRWTPIGWPCLAAAALFGLLLTTPAAAETPSERPAPEGAEETWWVLELDGHPAGWVLERWWSEGDRVITEEELSLRLARGESTLEISIAGRFEETLDGEPLSLWTRQAMASEPVETTYRFLPDGLEAVSVQGGRERRERRPPPEGEWLTPAEARRAEAAHHAAGDRRYEIRSLAPVEGPDPVTSTRSYLGEASPEAAADGAVSRWREETSTAPGVPSIVELDAEGREVRSSTDILGMDATAYRSDRRGALAAVAAAEAEPATEILVSSLVRPDRPIPDPGRVPRAVYELSLDDGSPVPRLPEGGAQRVAPGTEPGRLRVTVHRDPADAPPLPPPPPADSDEARAGRAGGASRDDAVTEAHLAPSLFVDHDDPAVRRLLERRRPADADPEPAPDAQTETRASRKNDVERADIGRARELSRFVHGYVGRKDLDTGLGSASQVARTRAGDCTEHAVLLAALLRAEGIPARLVTGLVYLEEFAGAEAVFGYHMWVQAAVGADGPQGVGESGRWLDLDPTLPWGFDATHIALGHSALSGSGREPELDRLLPLYGKLRIEVLELGSASTASGE